MEHSRFFVHDPGFLARPSSGGMRVFAPLHCVVVVAVHFSSRTGELSAVVSRPGGGQVGTAAPPQLRPIISCYVTKIVFFSMESAFISYVCSFI